MGELYLGVVLNGFGYYRINGTGTLIDHCSRWLAALSLVILKSDLRLWMTGYCFFKAGAWSRP